MNAPGAYAAPKSLLTIKSLLADRALTVERPRQQPPSLIFRLPAEMLAEMFMHATATAEVQNASESDLRMPLPMYFHFVLSHVCALWRVVALHTPSLWCRVVLHLRNRVTGFGNLTLLAKTCFERSCELPLALIITSSIAASSRIPNLSMDLVLPVRHRIRHLELQLPAVFTESIFKLPRNSLKVLESINICALIDSHDAALWAAEDNAMVRGPWFRSMSGLEGAPLLKSVKFSCMHPTGVLVAWRGQGFRPLGFDPYVAGLPWGQLTELALRDLEIRCDDAVYALEMATNLLHCSLDLETLPPLEPVLVFTNAPPTDSDPLPLKIKKPMTVPALLVLELAVSGSGTVATDFFDRLILPSLTELSIKYKDTQTLPCATLTKLQERSSFSLERFVLTSRTGDSLLPFFQSSPRICRLQLVFCGLELAPLVAALTRTAGGNTLLPRLRILTLVDSWAEETPRTAWVCATKAVVEMARSRWRVQAGSANPRLAAFTFGSGATLSEKKSARIHRLQAEGMRVRAVISLPQRESLARNDNINMILQLDES
ncbi:hypothetical protein DFH07DRAFT_948432 [Mycena maculata]|uniref:F-box domain-containing protein n=1 Tax=Mycena maculata TaxID=230809 RepID=A0AAD7KH81_9AGAR|nr:hypothetical protein DFH07DRAFT_948432 [Mycena maculata]